MLGVIYYPFGAWEINIVARNLSCSRLAMTALLLSVSFQALALEEFSCTMRWEHREESTPFVLEIDEDNVTTRGGVTNTNFRVAVNKSNDLLLYEPVKRPWPSAPLGFATMSLDKGNGSLIYSFVTDKFKLFAHGSCHQALK